MIIYSDEQLAGSQAAFFSCLNAFTKLVCRNTNYGLTFYLQAASRSEHGFSPFWVLHGSDRMAMKNEEISVKSPRSVVVLMCFRT